MLAWWRSGDPAEGLWSAPVVDRIEPIVSKYVAQWPAWGYRNFGAITADEGHDVGSLSSVKRAMARRNLLQPALYQAERRQLAAARREVVVEPPSRCNRVWQADFTQFKAIIQGATDLIFALQSAVEAAEAPLGHRLVEDCVDAATGEVVPLVVVTDNGPAMKSVAVARRFAARPYVSHVRTRRRAPHTHGVVERCFETLKYERLYRHDIASVIELADCVADFTDEYNTIRLHQALAQTPPLTAYLDDRTLKPDTPRPERTS